MIWPLCYRFLSQAPNRVITSVYWHSNFICRTSEQFIKSCYSTCAVNKTKQLLNQDNNFYSIFIKKSYLCIFNPYSINIQKTFYRNSVSCLNYMPKLLNVQCKLNANILKCCFSTTTQTYFPSKKDGINNIHSPKPLTSLKSKKRVLRKKRKIDETSEENAEGFQIIGHHKFLTFDPEFAIPDTALHKPPSKEFQTVAYATADEYDLEKLSQEFHSQGLYIESPIVELDKEYSATHTKHEVFKVSDPEDVVLLSAAYQVTPEPRSMYIFREGSVVFWNMPSIERQNIMKFLKKYQSGNYAEDIVEEESETLIYSYTDSPTRLKPSQHLILMNERGVKNLEKYAFSNALAMSVKLGVWEASLDQYVENIEDVTENLQKSGAVVLSQEEVLQRMGQLFALRHLINLSSDLLDTPDFYWEQESLGQLYNKTANYLSIQKRTSVMNIKLSHCLELMELMKSHLNERHAARLEWIIIILILIEVFFEILHFL